MSKFKAMGLNFNFSNRASTGFCTVFPMTHGHGLVIFLSKTHGFFQFKEVINRFLYIDIVCKVIRNPTAIYA